MTMLTGVLKTKFLRANDLFAHSGLFENFKPVFDYCINLSALQNESQQKNRDTLRTLVTQSKKVLATSIKSDPELKQQLAIMISQSETAATSTLVAGLTEWANATQKKKISKAPHSQIR